MKPVGCIWPDHRDRGKGVWERCDNCKLAAEGCEGWRQSFHAIQITVEDFQEIMLNGYTAWLNQDAPPIAPRMRDEPPDFVGDILGYDTDNDRGGLGPGGALA